ncbi:hypothetical protein BS78_02G009000 [Paspalum vaginatum]|nr:hypothetical protein BS78_02G009000 [Paspalum vaginatum]
MGKFDFWRWWTSKDGHFAQVEALVTVYALLCAIQVVFGWWRRCSSNLFIKYSLWLAYTLIPLVPIYTLGRISSFVYKGDNIKDCQIEDVMNPLSLLWPLVLGGALGSTFSLTVYDVHDNKQYTRHLTRQALYVVNMIAVVWCLTDSIIVSTLMFWFTLSFWAKSIIGTFTGIMASSCSDKQSMYLQDYMKNEHLISSSTTNNYDPVTLKGYNYLILDYGITVSQVWLSKEGILGSSGSDGKRLKEVCLSYALSHLLRRRFFGASCPEAKLQKTHDLVFQGLLSGSEEGCQAAYRVIETELAFTHDHFFTTNPSFGPLILLQLYIYLSSDYTRVIFTSWSITLWKGSIWSRTLGVCNKLPQLFGYWQNRIGLHSLLKDLHSRSIAGDMIGSLSSIFFVLSPPVFPREICNPGIKGPDRIPLTPRVKKAIAQALKSSDGHLSNGTSSLERNGQAPLTEEFLKGRSHARDLLIWHIETEYCDIAQSLQTGQHDDSALPDHDVAARISSYCAYLMAFVPELLPDHQLETTALFHRTRKQALQHLQKDKTLRAKYAKLSGDVNGKLPPQNGDTNHGGPPSEGGIVIDGQLASHNNVGDGQTPLQGVEIFDTGIQLGKRLQGIADDGGRWKILADFWTEMMLYIAPSDNARDHIQHLANGGEFITHLWALLTHAGILDRGQGNHPRMLLRQINQQRRLETLLCNVSASLPERDIFLFSNNVAMQSESARDFHVAPKISAADPVQNVEGSPIPSASIAPAPSEIEEIE